MSPLVTVFVPTYRGAAEIEQLVRDIFVQRIDGEIEVLVYDTTSGDGAPEILDRLATEFAPRLRWRSLPKSEFSHGGTRAKAARDANGEYIAFITQDASPAHDRWLYELLAPFDLNDKVVAVLGKQVPRPHAVPLLKGDIAAVFNGFGNDQATSLFYKDDFIASQGQLDVVTFYSDVNSASRRKFLTDTINYRDVPYAEDQLFGKDLIEAGYIKAYAPRASVVHTNDIALKDYKYRIYDETLGLRTVGIEVGRPSTWAVVKMVVRGSWADTGRILRDHNYSFKRKLYWLVVNPLYHIERWRGVRLAVDAPLDDHAKHQQYSLEQRQAAAGQQDQTPEPGSAVRAD